MKTIEMKTIETTKSSPPWTRFKAYNTVTGKWFAKGKGFVTDCKHQGTILDSVTLAFVRASFLNVGADSINCGYACGCDYCEGATYRPLGVL